MSLINEALKKAQKLRTGDPAALAPTPGGGHTAITKRREPRTTQQLVLIAAAALVLIVLSVVGTFWFVNRAPEPKPAPKPVAIKPADTSGPSPTIVVPPLTPPIASTDTPSATSPAASPPSTSTPSKPSPPPAPTPSSTPAAAQVVATPPATVAPAPEESVATPTSPTSPSTAPASAATAAATPPPVATDPRVHAFVDAVRVAGIRSSATGDSRVLMNDRVYRLNDIVERNLGIRLTKVEANTLTFTDANGAVYVKNF